MTDLIERLQKLISDRCGDGPSGPNYDPVLLDVLSEAAAALEAARVAAALARELEADVERYRWMKAQHKGPWLGSDGMEFPTLDAAIDQARGKGVQS